MASFLEQILIHMGLDKSGFDKGLHDASHALHTFHGYLGALGVEFSLGAAKEFVHGLLEMGESLKLTAETVGVTTNFLQTFQAGAIQSGITAERANGALERFTRHLAESGETGADVETEIRKLADAMANEEDPVKRAAIAFKTFGRSAADLIPLLSKGSRGLDAMAASAHKLTVEEIEQLEEFDNRLKQASRTLQVEAGHVLGWFFKIVEAAGRVSVKLDQGANIQTLGEYAAALGEASAEIDQENHALAENKAAKEKAARAAAAQAEAQAKLAEAYEKAGVEQAKADFESADAAGQLNELLRFRAELVSQMTKHPGASVENAKRLAALAKLGLDISKTQKEVDRQRLETAKAERMEAEKRLSAQEKLTNARRAAKEAFSDRSALTLEDLARRSPLTRAGFLQTLQARQIMFLEDRAKFLKAEGLFGPADEATRRALALRNSLGALSSGERDPMRSVAETSKEAAEALKRIEDNGLRVRPEMGE